MTAREGKQGKGTGHAPHRPEDRRLRWLRRRTLLAAVVLGPICAVAAYFDPAQLLRSYLIAFVFWLSVALGCLGIEMLGHVAPGGWSAVLRRPLEAASRTVAPMVVLFVPIVVGAKWLYPWAQPDAALESEAIAHKAPWLNLPFFVARAAVYFAVWIGVAWKLSRMSLASDAGWDPELARGMRKVSAVGLVLYCLTMSLAAVDWMMSLSPEWYSTIYGVYVIGGQAVSAMAFAVVVALWLARRTPQMVAIGTESFHDFGKMLLAFVMLWAYFAISQLLIIWSGNLPEDIPYYVDRARGGYQWVSLLLLLLHFAVPFLLLLSRDLKRDARRLAVVAGLLFVMRWVDVYWLIAPAFHPKVAHLHWLDPVCLVAVGAVWLYVFLGQLGKRPLVALGDPLVKEALEHG